MTNANGEAVGIDLGTTYSAIAFVDETGRPQTLNNAEGEKVTPSVVLFEESQVVVGKEALKAIATDAPRIAQCAKRELGHRLFGKTFGGKQYPPEVIQAWVLQKLVRDASQQLGGVNRAVITVPAYFDEVRRKATQDAGLIAGLEVLDIINEPTAAAIAFGAEHGFLRADGTSSKLQRILVYDLGGGTFDVTVMEIHGSEFTTLATDGDVQLGGFDWDQRLVNYAVERFTKAHEPDPRQDANALGRLWRECEDAKRSLSAREKTFIGCEYRGNAMRIEITRPQFQDLTRDLLDRTAFTTRQTLRASGLQWADIDRVLLIGGSTRMPAVRDLLHQLSGKHPDVSVSPDEAVAHGAALRASLICAQAAGTPPAFTIKNVNSHSLGVVATDPETKRPRTGVLIPRNTKLPAEARRLFKTQKANQRSILVQIVEGESADPNACSQIGRCVVRNLPPDLPAATPIDIAFRYEENGRLQIRVRVAGTKAKLHHELTRENSLTPEEISMWRAIVQKGGRSL
ncbi:MAG: Hsp70 family protein [Pirellulaceae bacterium]|nr:Hsp70 family protein [Planctomycetales bacterium]